MIDLLHQAKAAIQTVKPLVLCLTNMVTMDFMANSLLAVGAAPIMSCEESELEELISIVHAVYLNIGTLDEPFIARCLKAVEMARSKKKPIILDPVGAGASHIRTQTARTLMPFADIIRGNASEIMALVDSDVKTAGVEASRTTSAAKESADHLARELNNTIVISGREDYITDGKRHLSLYYGASLMPLVTGMGCTLTATIAAFRAVTTDSFNAASCATAFFGLCGQIVEVSVIGPGSFRIAFIDKLYTFSEKDTTLFKES